MQYLKPEFQPGHKKVIHIEVTDKRLIVIVFCVTLTLGLCVAFLSQ